MKFETVKMPEGLLKALQDALPNIPTSAWGSTPSGALVDLMHALRAAEVVPVPETGKELVPPPAKK